MPVSSTRKTIIVLVLILLFTVLAYFSFNTIFRIYGLGRSSTQNPSTLTSEQVYNNVIFSDSLTMGDPVEWEFRRLHAKVVTFVSEAGTNYVEVDTLGNKFKVFVNGNVPDAVGYVEYATYNKNKMAIEDVTFDEFKTRFPVGSDIGIIYVTKVPTGLFAGDRTSYCAPFPKFCEVAIIYEHNSAQVDAIYSTFTFSPDLILPAVSFYSDLGIFNLTGDQTDAAI